jgi:hypothetical protein
LDFFSFPIAHRSTRLVALYDGDAECGKLMRTIIRGVAQLATHDGFDPASAKVATHLFNPHTLVVRAEGKIARSRYLNRIATTAELGRTFIAYNPSGSDVLREACEWMLRVCANEEIPAEAYGRKTIWQPGYLIARMYARAADLGDMQADEADALP